MPEHDAGPAALSPRQLEELWPYLVEREKQALWSDVPMEPLTEGPCEPGRACASASGKGRCTPCSPWR